MSRIFRLTVTESQELIDYVRAADMRVALRRFGVSYEWSDSSREDVVVTRYFTICEVDAISVCLGMDQWTELCDHLENFGPVGPTRSAQMIKRQLVQFGKLKAG